MHKALLLILPLMMFPVPSGLDAESKAQRTPPSLAPQKIKYDKTAAEVTSSDKPYTSDPKIDIRAATGASLNLSQNSQTPVAQDFKVTGVQKVKLYFLREATKIVAILNAFAAQEGSDLHGLLITNATEDEIILYGDEDKRRQARRVIATLDLPLPGINMEMWGVQISSNKPEKMAEVILELREQINGTQQAVRDLYEQMQKLAREVVKDCDTPTEDNRRNNCLDPRFRGLLEETLGYRSALDSRRRLSLLDILLRLIAAEDPSKAAKDMALRLGSWLTKNHPYGVDEVRRVGRQPFERSMRTLGLHYEKGQLEDSVTEKTVRARLALLEFAVQYGRLVHEPESFSPYYLQQSADVLNSRLQGVVAALNLDMEDLFVTPTLKAMQSKVAGFKDVEYAQVGKTSVATLSGVPTAVTSHSVSAFDVTPPLRLSELLEKAKNLSNQVATFIPKEAQSGTQAATELTAGALPISQVIGLIAAFGEERSVWRELQAGVSLTITPTVLRNMSSAELQIDLRTADPQAGTREQGVRPLSRISQHEVKTHVYVNALDFFDLSSFVSQSTLDGGRAYVPIVGTVWRGLFSDVPVVGKLFSWKRGPQSVYQQSLVLTNSFITPTAMGVAVLYPTDLPEPDARTGLIALGKCKGKNFGEIFRCQQVEVERYAASLK